MIGLHRNPYHISCNLSFLMLVARLSYNSLYNHQSSRFIGITITTIIIKKSSLTSQNDTTYVYFCIII